MNDFKSFEEFVTSQAGQIPIWGFALNLLLASILSLILAQIYVKYGKSISNRKIFADNFTLICVTTALIITIVKSSLALSLGLVGALSIVRFRAAIKEPEELAYIFLTIAIGLGFGADQRLVTILGFAFAVLVLVAKSKKGLYYKENQNLQFTVSTKDPQSLTLEKIVETMKSFCSRVELKRFDETQEILEVSFWVEFDSFDDLNQSRSALLKLNDAVRITFLDNKITVS